MDDPDDQTLGRRWFLRETLFVIVGTVLWAAFGWHVALVAGALALRVMALI